MKYMTGEELRRKFVQYFESRGHSPVESSSLVPADDPTLLFTNAGMVQFKNIFTGVEEPPYPRAVTVQKCMRAGGKHNDLDNVGRTPRHQTFFEMLGNFSFGDYFKADAIKYAWDFLTGELGLPGSRLWASVHEDDDEAAELWAELTEVDPGKIVRLGDEENFWSMGDTGPCGPCSEILYDRGAEHRCRRADCGPHTCQCDRWLEIWNLVFMQYDRDESGRLSPLPAPSIDTGMGLERVAAVLQGKDSNFDTDLLRPIIAAAEEVTGREYGPGPEGFPFRVIADHVRAAAFLIADGVLPGNEFRGYVLRRVLRRAIRFGKVLGMDEPFLERLVPAVTEIMGGAYPELHQRGELITRVIRQEEQRFHRTLHQGSIILDDLIAKARGEDRGYISGEEAFMLYDTYGFPVDLTADAAEEAGMTVDEEGFAAAMERQRERARRAHRKGGPAGAAGGGELDLHGLEGIGPTPFTGYDHLALDTRVAAVLDHGDPETVAIILDETPFYPAGGGQVGDRGRITGDGFSVAVYDTARLPGDRIVHKGRLLSGRVKAGDGAAAEVDGTHRLDTARNHTVTHLLHAALRKVLGDHVSQAGSLVAPDRLRFDFTHFEPLTAEQMRQVEDMVNEHIMAGVPVADYWTSLEEAREAGAIALFGEQYGQRVRVVTMGDFSMELCGGTHLDNTARAGLFLITGESGVAAGVRRIEGVTGRAALGEVRNMRDSLHGAASLLKADAAALAERIERLLAEKARLEEEAAAAARRGAGRAAEGLATEAVERGGVRISVGAVDAPDAETLRDIADQVRDRLAPAVVLLAADMDGRAAFVATVTRSLVERGFHAGKLIRDVARAAGGGGGGAPHMAQAGARDAGAIPEALEHGRKAIFELLDEK